MRKLVILGVLISLFSFFVVAQDEPQSAETFVVTLSSPYAEDGHGALKHSEKANRNCFDFVSGSEVPCRKRWDLVYGNFRVSEEWDWFYVPASRFNARSRIVSLGIKKWDEISWLPAIEPLPELKPGERRTLRIDASGAKGADGAPGREGAPGLNGMNGDGSVSRGTYLPAEPVKSGAVTEPAKKPVITSEYLIKAVKGEMYLLRVVDDEHDFYVLMRVDEIVRGRTATISWRKLRRL